MYIKDFTLEKWLNPKDGKCKYNLGASCVKAFTVEELFKLVGQDTNQFMEELKHSSLHYGHFFGFARLMEAISKMYRKVTPDMILTVHGGTGANNMVITELVEPGDNVVAIVPNYQQHYSIPESLGAQVKYLTLKEENGYLPDLDELFELVDEKTRMITLSNPNNPSGAYIGEDKMKRICEIAQRVGAYVLSDEIYRGMDEDYMISVCDLYDRGIVTSSTSKVFSMAGTRVGWIVVRDKETHDRLENRRSYDTICGGVFDELIAAIALEHYDKILKRSRGIVKEGQKIFEEWIKTQPHLSARYKSYGTTAFVNYDYDISSTELCTRLFEEAGVLLCHGDCFDIPKSFRLGFGFGNPEVLAEGLQVMGDYLEKMQLG